MDRNDRVTYFALNIKFYANSAPLCKRFHILNFNQLFSPLILTQLFIQILAFTEYPTDILLVLTTAGVVPHQPPDPRHDVHIGKKVELLPLVGFLTHYLP